MNYYKYSNRRRNARDLGNPLFPRGLQRGAHEQSSLRKILALISLAGALLGWAYLLLASHFFRINLVLVKGDNDELRGAVKTMVDIMLKDKKFLFLDKNNIFIFSADETSKRLREQFFLQEAKIVKQFPNAIRIDFETKKPVLEYISGEWSYVLDIAGTIIERNFLSASGTPLGGDLPRFKRAEELDETSKTQLLDPDVVQFIRSVNTLIKDEAGIVALEFEISEDSPSTLKVKTEKNWQAYFNIRTDAQEQVNKLRVALMGIEEGSAPFSYIDLRFGDKVFIK